MVAAMVPTAHSDGGSRQPSPSLEAVAAAFPQLEILELIGQGGMGIVFKARQPKLNRLVALKLLPASLAEGDTAFAGRFEREGQLLARLHHPNIVAVHDSGTAGEFFYLIMEFVDGVNLWQAMRARRFTPAQALSIVPRICDALQYAHDEGVLHRDIKPENILLDGKGRVKLADFGIAKLLADLDPAAPLSATANINLTQSGSALGTPRYMAPEQRETPADIDHRADIYSLGVVFYELLTGELPREHFAPPSAKTDADPRVDAIVQQALEKERDRRQGSARQMKTQVESITGRASRALAKPVSAGRVMLIHALLAIACLWLLGFVAPKMLAMLSDMLGDSAGWSGLTRAVATMSRHFVVSSLLIVAAFGVDIGLCLLLSRKSAFGLRLWNRTVILGTLLTLALITVGLLSPLKPGIALFALRTGTATPLLSATESWSYTPRYLTEAKFVEREKTAKGELSAWSKEISMRHESGVITVTGPRERVRLIATMLRVLDQPEAKDPLQLPILNMPPEFFLRIAWPSLIMQNDFSKTPLTDALRDSLTREGITAPQLARALSAHVFELEKATFVNNGAPFESIVHSPGASIFYDVTIPCSDQPEKPLTLRIERTTQQIGSQSNFANFAPWLIEEAKKQSKEPFAAGKREVKKEAGTRTAVPPDSEAWRLTGVHPRKPGWLHV
jgi:serine/threonine protein kinase